MDYRPDVFLINDLNSANDRNLVAEEIYVINKEKGTIVNNRRMRGTFISILELHSFPFDMHTLKVQFYFHPCYDLIGPVPGVQTAWWGAHGNNEFNIADQIVDRFSHKESPGSGILFETYDFEVNVIRKYSSYLVNVGALMEGLFALGLSVLMLENDELNDRVNLTLVVVLAHSAFKMMVASMMPALGYMTILDKRIMTGFWLNCGAGLFSLATVYLELEKETAKLDQLDFCEDLHSYLGCHPCGVVVSLRRFQEAVLSAGEGELRMVARHTPQKCSHAYPLH